MDIRWGAMRLPMAQFDHAEDSGAVEVDVRPVMERQITRQQAKHDAHADRTRLLFCSESKRSLARPKGFEPLTPRFVVWCSIQLSYGRRPGRGRDLRSAVGGGV